MLYYFRHKEITKKSLKDARAIFGDFFILRCMSNKERVYFYSTIEVYLSDFHGEMRHDTMRLALDGTYYNCNNQN